MHCYTFLPVANETAESHSGMGNLKSSRIIYFKDCVSSERGFGYLFCCQQGHAVEQPVDWTLIFDAMPLMWHQRQYCKMRFPECQIQTLINYK